MGITVSGLTKRFGAEVAVNDISFSVPEKCFFAVVGPSGCGKSTLLRLIAGLERPCAGTIALAGVPVAGPGLFVAPEARNVGVVFQSYALWPHLSVLENVAFPYQARGMDGAQARKRARAHLATVALSPLADRRPEALSGGQRQRVALARALAGQTRTILMDEPLANLDPHLRAAMEAELRAFHDRTGVATFYITHDQREAMALADIMAVMMAGRILQIGPPQTIYQRPASAEVARFIGRGAVLAGQIRDGAVWIAGQRVDALGAEGRPDGPAQVFVRPQDLSVTAPGQGMALRLRSVLYRGGLWEAEGCAEGLEAPLMLTLDAPARPGEGVGVLICSGWVLPA